MNSRILLLCFCVVWPAVSPLLGANDERRYLYVAEPGIRNYLEYGGHGLLVYDMDHGHRFVKRIPTAGLDEKGQPLNVKGICASVPLKRVFISTPKTMMAVDLVSEKEIGRASCRGKR